MAPRVSLVPPAAPPLTTGAPACVTEGGAPQSTGTQLGAALHTPPTPHTGLDPVTE